MRPALLNVTATIPLLVQLQTREIFTGAISLGCRTALEEQRIYISCLSHLSVLFGELNAHSGGAANPSPSPLRARWTCDLVLSNHSVPSSEHCDWAGDVPI